MKRDQSLNEAFADVGVDRGGGLAATDDLGGAKIHSNDFSVRAAEIDEEGERIQGIQSLEFLLPASNR